MSAHAGSAAAGAAVLAGLAAGGVALLVLALLVLPLRAGRALLPERLARLVAMGLAAAGGLGVLLHLMLGAPPARLELPFQVAGVVPGLVLDAVASFFLLVLLPGVLAWVAVAAGLAGVLGLAGAAVLALLAADAGTLGLCLLLAGLAGAWLRRARGLGWGVGFAVAALVVALALPAGDGAFAAIRAQPAQGGAAALMLALVLAAGLGLGLAGPVLGTLGLYLLVRLGLDLAGPVAMGWAAPLLLAGAAGVALGGLAAVRAAGVRGVMAGMGVARGGLVALGLGLAVAARAVDDGPAAALALGSALLLLAVLGWAQALWGLVAHGLVAGAGSDTLGRLGGLGQRMRFTLIGALAAGLAVSLLPPGGGFAGLWLLLRAAVTLPRGGGAAEWAMAVLVALALGAGAALLGFAVLRVLGVAFLGRPRGPRAAAAEEVAPGLRWAMLGFAAVLALGGLLPGLVLAAAAPAVARLAGAAVPWGVLGVAGYAPLGLVLLVALAAVAVALAVRALSPAGHRVAPVWEGGAPPPPAWLPFGDPATQAGPEGFAAALVRPLAWPAVRPGWLEAWHRRAGGWAGWLMAVPLRAGPAAALALLGGMLVLHGVGLW